jgi:hypothetical protein
MTDKLPTINIKGKEYVMVKDRILAFNELYPNGSIVTEIISQPESKQIIIKATITPDVKNPARIFVDFSQAVVGQGMINTTSALENASTSAVGRALAYVGIGVIESIAGADEVVKSINRPASQPTSEHFCTIHNKPMKERTGKNGVKWFDHRWQNEAGEWQKCSGIKKADQATEEVPPFDDEM